MAITQELPRSPGASAFEQGQVLIPDTPATIFSDITAFKIPDEFTTPEAIARREEALAYENLSIYDPLAAESWLGILRNRKTTMEDFRKYTDLVATSLGVHLAEDMQVKKEKITTPCGDMERKFVDGEGILMVEVLRSAHPVCEGIAKALPNTDRGMLDIKRDEETALPHLKYDGLANTDVSKYDEVLIPDPMLATGGSATTSIEMMKARGAKNIHVVAMVAAPEGILALKEKHPDVKITVCAVDWGLNSKKYIVPGLGDFGDRYYGDDPVEIEDIMNGKVLKYHETDMEVCA